MQRSIQVFSHSIAHLIFAKWLRSSHKVCWQRNVSCKREPSSSCNAIRTCTNTTMNSAGNWMKAYFSSQLFKIVQCCSSVQAFWPEFLFVGMNGSWAWGRPSWNINQLSWAPLPCHVLNWNIFKENASENIPNNVPSWAMEVFCFIPDETLQ